MKMLLHNKTRSLQLVCLLLLFLILLTPIGSGSTMWNLEIMELSQENEVELAVTDEVEKSSTPELITRSRSPQDAEIEFLDRVPVIYDFGAGPITMYYLYVSVNATKTVTVRITTTTEYNNVSVKLKLEDKPGSTLKTESGRSLKFTNNTLGVVTLQNNSHNVPIYTNTQFLGNLSAGTNMTVSWNITALTYDATNPIRPVVTKVVSWINGTEIEIASKDIGAEILLPKMNVLGPFPREFRLGEVGYELGF
ncbi:MAG: hypothetical protein ACFFDT_28115, partial [Candidatus Hodarchaeota archaeon]